MIGNIGMGELLLIFIVILLVFGAKRIPEIARGLGKGIREFKDATREISNELTMQPDHRPSPRPATHTIQGAAPYTNTPFATPAVAPQEVQHPATPATPATDAPA